MTENDLNEFVSDEAKTYAKDKARSKIADKVADELAPPVSHELVKFSDAALERGYKISYELTEHTLPPKISREIENQLRISTDRIKKENAGNLNEATVNLITASTNTIFDVVSGDKNFDESGRALATQAGSVIKNIVIERGKQIAIDESKRIGRETTHKIIRQVGGKNNPVLNAMAFGDIVKDLALDWADGKISDGQFVKLVVRRCAVLALQTLTAEIPFASVAIERACSEIFLLMDAAEQSLHAAESKRNTISKIKTDALAEMNHQRDIMKKYFADEKLQWNKNIQDGFALISKGTYSNDVEVIAQGLDTILQNFGGQVAFSNREKFRKDFRQRKLVVNL